MHLKCKKKLLHFGGRHVAGDRGILERFGVRCVREERARRRDCFHLAGLGSRAGGGPGPGPKVSAGRAGEPSGEVAAEPPRAGAGPGRAGGPRRPGSRTDGKRGCLRIFTAVCALPGAPGGGRGGGGELENPLPPKFDSTFLWFVASLF